MQIDVGGRGGGKTWRMVHAVKDNPNAVMVVPNYAMKKDIMEKYGLTDKQVISVAEGKDKLRGRRVDLYVDNIDIILWELFGHQRIAGITVHSDGWY